MKPALLAIVGRKGSGKSEVLATLIKLLTEKGVRVGVMKHLAREDFEIDQPGKDTHQYRLEGAETVMLLGRKKRAIFSDLQLDSDWEENLSYFEGFDLVFLEGYFLKTVQTLEVYHQETGAPLLTDMNNIFAVCSDTLTAISAPHFSPSTNHLEELVLLIQSKLLLVHTDGKGVIL